MGTTESRGTLPLLREYETLRVLDNEPKLDRGVAFCLGWSISKDLKGEQTWGVGPVQGKQPSRQTAILDPSSKLPP